MRYWGYFAAKLVAGGGIMFGLLELLNWSFPPEPCFYQYCSSRFSPDEAEPAVGAVTMMWPRAFSSPIANP